jgi:hypothetical protein
MPFANADPGPSRRADREELAAGVAIVNAAYQSLAGRMSGEQLQAVVAGFVGELWDGDAGGAIMAAAVVALRLARLLAREYKVELEDVLAELGAEAATLPQPPPEAA